MCLPDFWPGPSLRAWQIAGVTSIHEWVPRGAGKCIQEAVLSQLWIGWNLGTGVAWYCGAGETILGGLGPCEEQRLVVQVLPFALDSTTPPACNPGQWLHLSGSELCHLPTLVLKLPLHSWLPDSNSISEAPANLRSRDHLSFWLWGQKCEGRGKCNMEEGRKGDKGYLSF